MTEVSGELSLGRRNRRLGRAIYQNRALSKDGVSERLFAFLFSGLVYPQIWEDPDVDMEAMALAEGHRIVTIASGGCNVLAYLTRSPGSIDAVDLNTAHVALNRLKLTAVRHLPGHKDLLRFFGGTGEAVNGPAYERFVAPHLDPASRAYWEKRDWRGRRRISVFQRNFYRTGLLGLFIAAGHRVAVQVSSGAHPRYARNPGTGEPAATAATTVRAEQEISHGGAHPSAIDLPVWT